MEGRKYLAYLIFYTLFFSVWMLTVSWLQLCRSLSQNSDWFCFPCAWRYSHRSICFIHLYPSRVEKKRSRKIYVISFDPGRHPFSMYERQLKFEYNMSIWLKDVLILFLIPDMHGERHHATRFSKQPSNLTLPKVWFQGRRVRDQFLWQISSPRIKRMQKCFVFTPLEIVYQQYYLQIQRSK